MSHSPHHDLSFFSYKDALALETDSSHVPDGESALKVCDTIQFVYNSLPALKQAQLKPPTLQAAIFPSQMKCS